MLMTELEYVIGRFDEKFHGFCGKRILLHGSREYAEGILKAFDPLYGFLGSQFDACNTVLSKAYSF